MEAVVYPLVDDKNSENQILYLIWQLIIEM